MTTYVSSMAAQDGEAACAVLTRDLQDQLTEAVESVREPSLRGKSCAELLNLVSRQGGGGVQKGFEAARKGRITNIEVKGDRATMISEASLGGRKVRIKYEAQRDGARWMLSCCLASG